MKTENDSEEIKCQQPNLQRKDYIGSLKYAFRWKIFSRRIFINGLFM